MRHGGRADSVALGGELSDKLPGPGKAGVERCARVTRAESVRAKPANSIWPAAPLLTSWLLVGCDPVIDIQGAFFPAWVLCILGGLALSGIAHRALVALDLQPHLGPPALVYPSLVVLLTMALWLVFFRD